MIKFINLYFVFLGTIVSAAHPLPGKEVSQDETQSQPSGFDVKHPTAPLMEVSKKLENSIPSTDSKIPSKESHSNTRQDLPTNNCSWLPDELRTKDVTFENDLTGGLLLKDVVESMRKTLCSKPFDNEIWGSVKNLSIACPFDWKVQSDSDGIERVFMSMWGPLHFCSNNCFIKQSDAQTKKMITIIHPQCNVFARLVRYREKIAQKKQEMEEADTTTVEDTTTASNPESPASAQQKKKTSSQESGVKPKSMSKEPVNPSQLVNSNFHPAGNPGPSLPQPISNDAKNMIVHSSSTEPTVPNKESPNTGFDKPALSENGIASNMNEKLMDEIREEEETLLNKEKKGPMPELSGPADEEGGDQLANDDDAPLTNDNNDQDFIEDKAPDPVPKSQKKSEKLPQADIPPVPEDRFFDTEDSHFLSYFLMFTCLVVLGYIGFHNKNKILALALEGRRSRSSRRKSNSTRYSKLESNLEEAMMSNSLKSNSTQIIY